MRKGVTCICAWMRTLNCLWSALSCGMYLGAEGSGHAGLGQNLWGNNTRLRCRYYLVSGPNDSSPLSVASAGRRELAIPCRRLWAWIRRTRTAVCSPWSVTRPGSDRYRSDSWEAQRVSLWLRKRTRRFQGGLQASISPQKAIFVQGLPVLSWKPCGHP